MILTELAARCDKIEECYEFLLAYAAQGLPGESGSQSGGNLRMYLRRAIEALSGLAENYSQAVKQEGLEPAEKYQRYLEVVDRDSGDALAAIELVMAQPSISSQLIDNLNASIHLRALLTDLFLIDEILKLRSAPSGVEATT